MPLLCAWSHEEALEIDLVPAPQELTVWGGIEWNRPVKHTKARAMGLQSHGQPLALLARAFPGLLQL